MLKKSLHWLGWALILGLLGWMTWDLFASDHGYLVVRREQAELQQLRQELRALKQQREKLAHEILRLRNNPKALEELVHRELGYLHPDEFMLIVPPQDTKGNKAADE